MHLGMSGRFSITVPDARATRIGEYVHETGNDAVHDHVTIHMQGGAAITYNDPRRFGFMVLVKTAERAAHPLFCDIGVEPLGDELTPAHLASRAHGRKTDLKAFLLDQRNVAGLGNIYVAEALFRAHLNPKRAASLLALRNGAPSRHAERLVPEIKAVLGAALQAGGSTLRDYRQADGSSGDFQNRFAVYGLDGKSCPGAGCTGTIKRIVQAGRSTFYCPKCQK
jgi:formamidopyrimidine-DNA glycosylase